MEKQKKEEEKRCKNQAYYFILSDDAFTLDRHSLKVKEEYEK